ncbi:MAG: DsbA family oxidoreductase [Burkholderiales bacterium]
MPLTIDIVSDVVCPWCFVGKRKLATALDLYAKERPDAPAPRVTWRPFQLNPQMPAAGMLRADYVQRKFGRSGTEVYARVSQAGKAVGIDFAFDRIVRQPNTLAAHALIALADKHGKQDEVVDALFHAYFFDGRDLTDVATLTEVATGAGLPRDAVEGCLADEQARRTVAAEDERAREMGVSGVPCFIFNGRTAVSGAHEPQTLLQAMLQSESATADER